MTTVSFSYNRSYPSVVDLKRKAKKRIPKFAFDYLEGACNDELNAKRNKDDFQDIKLIQRLVENYKGKFKIMIDSGMRSGPDIARALASGADFTFVGRPFMYGVGSLRDEGGDHTIEMFKAQLYQIMQQLSCEVPEDLSQTLIK